MLKKLSVLALCAGIISCGGGSDGPDYGPKPDSISLSVAVPDDFYVDPGEEFTIAAIGDFTPYHPDIELQYSWSKTIYPKPFDELLADFDGNVEVMLASLDREFRFSDQQTLEDIAPDLHDSAYISYTVQVSAAGYIVERTDDSLSSSFAGSIESVKVRIR